jgi:hypothetical membrane protein
LIDNRVSDLGSTSCGSTVANSYICSPLHAVMNATFILTGGLILGGLLLTRPVWPRRKLSTWGLILLGIAGAGAILIGLSPENVNVLLHLIGALNIPAGNAAMILLGLVIWRDRRWPRFAPWFSVALGAIGFLGLGWPLHGDLDRSRRWPGRTNRALSADHLVDRLRTVVCSAGPPQQF